MAAGDFTCADLQTILVNSDKAWLDNATKKDYVSYSETIKAVMAEQTASFPELEKMEKDEKVKIYWVADCANTLADCDDDCNVGGAIPEATCKEYELDLCKKASFSVPEKLFRKSNLTREEVVAKAMMKRMKELDEYLSQAAVTAIDSFAGVNVFAGIGQVVGTTTYIAPSLWTADLMGYLAQVGIMNKFSNPYLINGTNLWQQNWQANFNNLNSDQKDALAKFGSLRSYWDPFNIDLILSPDKVSFLIDKGAVAFVSKAYYPANSPVEYIGAGQIRYSVESKNLMGVFYDVVYTNRCVADEIYHDFTLYVHAGIFQNPIGCSATNTGVLKLQCGVAP